MVYLQRFFIFDWQGIKLPLGLLCGFLLCVAALLYITKTYQRFGEEYALSPTSMALWIKAWVHLGLGQVGSVAQSILLCPWCQPYQRHPTQTFG